MGDAGSPGKAAFSESEECSKKGGNTILIVDTSLRCVSPSRPRFVPLLHRCHSVRLDQTRQAKQDDCHFESLQRRVRWIQKDSVLYTNFWKFILIVLGRK